MKSSQKNCDQYNISRFIQFKIHYWSAQSSNSGGYTPRSKVSPISKLRSRSHENEASHSLCFKSIIIKCLLAKFCPFSFHIMISISFLINNDFFLVQRFLISFNHLKFNPIQCGAMQSQDGFIGSFI